jgi:DNA-binding NarL/FixJ family response regulator
MDRADVRIAPAQGPVTPQPGDAVPCRQHRQGGVVSHPDGDTNGAAGAHDVRATRQRDVASVTRLLIVDDHVAVRQGLQLLFATVPGIEVVGVAADGCQAIAQVAQLSPDVVLMDVQMPKIDGVEATRQIIATHPASRIVILTASDDQSRIEDALRAGAASYVPKHSDPDQVVRAVQAAHGGSLTEVGSSRVQRALEPKRPTAAARAGPRTGGTLIRDLVVTAGPLPPCPESDDA